MVGSSNNNHHHNPPPSPSPPPEPLNNNNTMCEAALKQCTLAVSSSESPKKRVRPRKNSQDGNIRLDLVPNHAEPAPKKHLGRPPRSGITGTGFTRRAITAEAEEDIAAKIICEQGARTVCSSGPIRNVTIRQPPSASSLSGTDVSYEEMRESYIDGKSPSKSSEELLIGISNTLPDSQSPSNTSSKERTRELLIAISDSVPDKDEDTILNSDIMPKGKDADNFERSNDEFGPKWISSKDADDYEIANSEKFKNKIRSELISISYTKSFTDHKIR